MMDRSGWPKTISAGDTPFSLGVFLNSSIPRENSSEEISPAGEIFVTSSFMVATAASACPLLCGYSGVEFPH
jgi:hypothetical protein